MEYKGLQLDPFQERAIEALERGESVLVGAPTGAGKTLIAEYALEKAIREGRQVIYTAPIKALSNQKFRDFSAAYPEHIGIMTGDVTINPAAPCLIMTTEIFRNTIFENPRRLDGVDYVILDEIHYMNDIERGTVWEESIIFAPEHIGLICLSATVPNIHELAAWARSVRSRPLAVVEEYDRPVPLRHDFYLSRHGLCALADIRRLEKSAFGHAIRNAWEVRRFMRSREARHLAPSPSDRAYMKLLDHVSTNGELPCLYFAFSRRDCEEKADGNISRNTLSSDEKVRVMEEFERLAEKLELEESEELSHLRRLVALGIAYHHAGLLPMHKELVERLFTTGLIRIIFATETFSLGINMPARSVVFDSLKKFDGVRTTLMKPSEYHQMAGRSGRRGIDEEGMVYSILDWPYVTASDVESLTQRGVEEIESQFNLSYSTLLNLYLHLGKKLFTACEKSFKNFRAVGEWRRGRGRRHERRKGRGPGAYDGMVEQVRARMAVLQYLGYIEAGTVTEKGEFAKRVFGYEVQVSEILWSGLLDRLSDAHFNVVMTAIIFEGRKGTWHRRGGRDILGKLRRQLQEVVWNVNRAEKTLGVRELTKELDFDLASAAFAWSNGCDFEALRECTDADAGDIVRAFRMAVQLLRETRRALSYAPHLGGASLARRIERATEAFNRDVIDAEKQLRLGCET